MGYDDTNWSTNNKLCQTRFSVGQYLYGTMERHHQAELNSESVEQCNSHYNVVTLASIPDGAI